MTIVMKLAQKINSSTRRMLRNAQYGVHRGMPHLASAKRFSKTTTPLNHLCFFPLKTRPRHILQVCAWENCFTAYRKCCILEITASTAGRLGFEAAERLFPAFFHFCYTSASYFQMPSIERLISPHRFRSYQRPNPRSSASGPDSQKGRSTKAKPGHPLL